MKKTLLSLVLAITMSFSFAQQVINLSPTDNIQAVIDTLTMQTPVIINLAPGNYNTPISIDTSIHTSLANYLIIQSADINNMAELTSAITDVITLNVGYVTIKSLKIISGGQGSPILIKELLSSINSINRIKIDNCIIEVGSNNYSGIAFGFDSTPAHTHSDVYITNNTILNGNTGVYLDGYGFGAISTILIENNTFRNQKITSLHLTGVNNIQVNRNNIQLPLYNDYNGSIGIYLSNINNDTDSLSVINANTIYSNSIDSVMHIGIKIESGFTESLYISNNYINIENTNIAVTGIDINYSNAKIYNNTVNLKGENGTAIKVECSVSESPILKNNIFASENTAMLLTSSNIQVSNYNCFFAGDSLPISFFETRYSVASWKSSFSFLDQNSIEDNPNFEANTAKYSNIALDNVASFIPEITTDMNGIARNQPMCDMGAIELMFIDLGQDLILCSGETLAVSAPTAYSYLWNTGATTQEIIIMQTGTYTVTVHESEFGPLAVDSIHILQGASSIINGTVMYSGGTFNADDVMIELYIQHEEDAYFIEKIAETYSSSTGTFTFTDVESSIYLIRGVIQNTDYNGVVTCYYGNTIRWEDATYLEIGCGETLNYNFEMAELANISGDCAFNGLITYLELDKSASSVGEPVTGAEIYIEQDPSDEPIANTLTGNDGIWTVDSLEEGTYKIRVDIPGLNLISTYTGIAVIPDGDPQNDFNFVVDTNSGGGIMTDTSTAILIVNNQQVEISVYPNPVTDFINVETTTSTPVDVNFTLVNISGKTVYSSENNKNYVGNYKKSVNITDLEAGVYVLNLKLGNSFYIKKIIKE